MWGIFKKKEFWTMDNTQKIAFSGGVGIIVIAALGVAGLFFNEAQMSEKPPVIQELSVDCSQEVAYLLGKVSFICSDPVATRAFQRLAMSVQSLAINNLEKMDIIKSQQSILERFVEKKIRSSQPEKYNFAFAALAKGDPALVDGLIDETLTLINLEEQAIIAAVLYREKGAIWFAGNAEKSLKAYQRSIVLDDNHRAGWSLVGLLYQKNGELNAAEIAYTKLLDLADNNPEYQALAHMHLGSVNQLRGNLEQATTSYEKALTIAINNGFKVGEANAYVNLGLVNEIFGTLDQAITYYKKALAINVEMSNKKNMAAIYNNLGLAYQTRGQFDQAVICYEKALVLNKIIGNKEGEAIVYANLGGVQETLEWINEDSNAQVSTLE